jgi:electron transport complex protein RnfG
MGSDNINVDSPVESGIYTCYKISDADNNPIGSAITTAENAFGGPMKVLVGFDTNGNILGYTVLEHAETPGLGAKADTWFQKGNKGDIIGKNPGKDVFKVSKDQEGGIDAITASTITSRAFLRAIENAYNEYFASGTDATSGAKTQLPNE